MKQTQTYKKWQLIALLTSLACLIINYALGIIVSPENVSHPIVYRDIGAALALPTIGGFCFFVLPVLVEKAKTAITETAVSTGSDKEITNQYLCQIAKLPKQLLVPAIALAAGIVVLYFTTEGLFYVEELGLDANLKRFLLVPQALYMWSGIILGIGIIYRVTVLVTDYLEKHLNVDLYSASELFPIANTVFWNILFFAFGLSLVPLFWLGGVPHLKDFVLAMIVFLIVTNLMFYPLLRVRHIIVSKKALALQSYRQSKRFPNLGNRSIDNLIKDLERKDPVKFRKSKIKEEIINAREWPVNIHYAIRFGCLALLPATTWAGSIAIRWLAAHL